MSATEYAEWKVYEKLYGPLGAKRGDYQAASISSWGLLPHLDADARDITVEQTLLDFDPDPSRAPKQTRKPIEHYENFEGVTDVDG